MCGAGATTPDRRIQNKAVRISKRRRKQPEICCSMWHRVHGTLKENRLIERNEKDMESGNRISTGEPH